MQVAIPLHVLTQSCSWVVQGARFKPLNLPERSRRVPDRIDVFIGTTVCISLGIIIVYKYVTNTIEYMTQPCHLVSL
jgi:hypothetical protein